MTDEAPTAAEVEVLIAALEAAYPVDEDGRLPLCRQAAAALAALTAERDEWRTKATEWNDPLGAASIAYHQQQLAEDRATKAEAELAQAEMDRDRYAVEANKAEAALAAQAEETTRQRDRADSNERQLVWVSVWCERQFGVDTNKVIGSDGWPRVLVEVVAQAAEAALRQAVIVGWMVGDDPQTAAMYNAGVQDMAYDAARRWNKPITALVLHPGAPKMIDAAPAAAPREKP